MDLLLVQADARRIPLPDDSVQCCVTSPPYWGLRKYAGEQELIWGGTIACEHKWVTERYYTEQTAATETGEAFSVPGEANKARLKAGRWRESNTCECGAWRGAYGLEPQIEMYVAHTVEILREVRRVLRPDGVCFWNVGDSYAATGGMDDSKAGPKQQTVGGSLREGDRRPNRQRHAGLKPKDLCLIPQRVALAAQADGWWVRSMIVWAKPNPMPESVRDRPTDAYEHIIMLTKSERYFWNPEALAMEPSASSLARLRQPNLDTQNGSDRVPGKTNGPMKACFGGRNKHAGYENRKHSGREDEGNYIENGVNVRNVWVFSPQPYKEAHFATFPEELPRRCILAASKVGDTVLDPFGGSGTTGRVAIELRRRAVLLDLAYGSEYAALAKKRTTNVQLEAFA